MLYERKKSYYMKAPEVLVAKSFMPIVLLSKTTLRACLLGPFEA